MRFALALLGAMTATAACPAPSITSVDGLAGGKLTSDIEAPTVRAEAVTTDLVTAKTLQAEGLVASTVEATTSVTTPALEADRVTTDNVVVRGQTVFGAPLGAVPLPIISDGRPGYRAADRECREAFGDTAHVCEATEVMAAYRAGVDPPVELHQAAVNTFASYATARAFTGNENSDNYINVDDCDGWVDVNTFGATSTPTGEALSGAYPIIHTYLALHYDDVRDAWSLRPPFLQANCNQVKLACCG